MKKRAMKKWIPKDTPYCYTIIKEANPSTYLMIKRCKWFKYKEHETDEYGNTSTAYCSYIGKSDKDIECGLLWDSCKECGEHCNYNIYRWAKWRYKHRNLILRYNRKEE